MIIDIGTGVDESVVRWKYNDKEKWRDADIDELIHLYESVVHCKDCRHYAKGHCYMYGGQMNDDDYCSRAERREE